jgi:pyruvate dehydrogenase E2 component (dihydrolipoamide acetyltransferase)
MAHVVIMPKQGQSVESCIITKWHKMLGDSVKKGELLFSYETDKAAFDFEADAEGKLLLLLAEEGDDVPCLMPVCIIGNEGEDISGHIDTGGPKQEQHEEQEHHEKTKPKVTAAPLAQARNDGEAPVSPRAKRAAERLGVDLALSAPSGAGGRVMERDIYSIPESNISGPETKNSSVSAQADYTEEKLSNVRKLIARSMHESLSNLAQLTHHSSFDAANLLKLREKLKAEGKDITINDIILFAVSRALIKHPYLNAHYLGEKMRLFHSVNLGIAVDTDRGLLVPTLYGADKKSLSQISKESKELIAAARSGKIDPKLLANGTFTVTNLGVLGVESFTPVINPPQTAILGVCALQTRVKNAGSNISFYQAMGLSLTYDHRAVDGAPAARFAKELGEMLENIQLTAEED